MKLKPMIAGLVAVAAVAVSGVVGSADFNAAGAPLPPALAGVFNTHCSLSHSKQVDPIVAPNGPSAHLHDFFGNDTTDADSTLQSMLGQPTSCATATDTAGYWVPAMYQNGVKLDPTLLNVYYRRSKGNPPATAFPADFRMISHDSGWACGAGTALTAEPRDCGSGFVTARVLFPQCWDGHSTDSPDHMAHIMKMTVKGCASMGGTWMPHILFAVRYPTHVAAGLELAPGAPDYHADFWNTWDQPTLEDLVADCLNAGVNCKNIHD